MFFICGIVNNLKFKVMAKRNDNPPKKKKVNSSFNMDEMTVFPKRAEWKTKKLPDGTEVTSAMLHPKALDKVNKAAKTIQNETKAGRPYSKAANSARVSGAINKHIVQPGGVTKFARRTGIPGMAVAAALYGYNKYQDSKSSNAKPSITNSSSKSQVKPTSATTKQDSTTNKTKVRAVNPEFIPGGNKKAKGGKVSRKFACGGKMSKRK